MKQKLFIIIASVCLAVLGASSAVSASKQSKVTICHHTGSQTNPTVTIIVAQSAVNAHVTLHGDTVGSCQTVNTADLCANIAGVQTTVPADKVVDGVNCVDVPDEPTTPATTPPTTSSSTSEIDFNGFQGK